MKSLIRLFLLSIIAAAPLAARAQEGQFQSREALKTAVHQFLVQQTMGQTGEARITVGEPDVRLKLPACVRPEAFSPNGARLAGRTVVGVRCGQPSWQVYLTANIRIHAPAWVPLSPLSAGAPIALTDLRQEMVDVTTLTAPLVTHPGQIVGKTLNRSVAAGLPLRLDVIKDEDAVAAGDLVRVEGVGPGFKVSAEGKTLSGAGVGQSVRVRVGSGQVVTGVVRTGKVVELII